MTQRRIPAVFMRGGTSNAIVFHQKDLPTDRKLWDDIFSPPSAALPRMTASLTAWAAVLPRSPRCT